MPETEFSPNISFLNSPFSHDEMNSQKGLVIQLLQGGARIPISALYIPEPMLFRVEGTASCKNRSDPGGGGEVMVREGRILQEQSPEG